MLRFVSIFTGRGAAKLGLAWATILRGTDRATLIPPDSSQKDIIVAQLVACRASRAVAIKKVTTMKK